jgi:hypothetical protein
MAGMLGLRAACEGPDLWEESSEVSPIRRLTPAQRHVQPWTRDSEMEGGWVANVTKTFRWAWAMVGDGYAACGFCVAA